MFQFLYRLFTLTRLEKKILAHREGRTRSLQITALHDSYNRKSLTLYPIELGGRHYRRPPIAYD